MALIRPGVGAASLRRHLERSGHSDSNRPTTDYLRSPAFRAFLQIIPSPLQALYLHSDGGVCGNADSAGVTNRFLDNSAPTGTLARCKDSGVVNFAGGNPWKEIGTWSETLP